MTRESCIMHPPKQAMAIVRQDYYELTGRDACAAALLNIFEYWANGAIASDGSTEERPWVGARPIREFEQMLLGISTDKQIRKRLLRLESLGYIQSTAPARRGAAKTYRVCLPEIQQAVSTLALDRAIPGRSFDPTPCGQTTEQRKMLRLDDPLSSGQTTKAPLVKQPESHRSNDQALKNKLKEFKKEKLKEDKPLSSCLKNTVSKNKASSSREPEPVLVGTVRYAQSPKEIDLSQLWEHDPLAAKKQVRSLASGHKRPEMVAHSVGHWWLGPNLNDFDEHLIQACQNRKRKFQQANSIGDAKTYINNMLRNGDWGNLALRCEEATTIKEKESRRTAPIRVRAVESLRNPFERTDAERRDSAMGLARFRLIRGQVAEAIAIARRFNFELPGYRNLSEQVPAALSV